MLNSIMAALESSGTNEQKAREILAELTRICEPAAWLNKKLHVPFLATEGNKSIASEAYLAGELEPLFRAAPSRVRELEDLLLWVLYHHQGGASHIGQPIRRALGIGPYADMTREQIERGKAAAKILSNIQES